MAGHKFGSAAPGRRSTFAAPQFRNPIVSQPRKHASARIKKVGRTFLVVEYNKLYSTIEKTAIDVIKEKQPTALLTLQSVVEAK